jgi:probable HAF family extracellular repeat protein
MHDLGALPSRANYCIASGINAKGQVVGGSNISLNGPVHAFLWQKGKGMQDLSTLLGGAGSSLATGVNDQGQVVGLSEIDPHSTDAHAVLWTSSS